MKVKVKYFASLKDQLGRDEELIELQSGTAVQSLWRQLTESESLPDHILTAINHEYVQSDTIIQDGDEIAFFPPVTGG